ncbi:3'-5' exonuclease [Brevibacterium litoralis]|uniref:3'-5' exonuclease n=1 Tax=Brevibacterium litoralis TaxID=3138935 RepID=UPI0032EB2581
MAKSTVILHKAVEDLDGSVHGKAYKFLTKLGKDDASKGLHIEPIHHSVDPKFRTGRVDDFWRAVLFKLAGSSQSAYVFYGIYPHDDAIKLARKLRLDVNPINGITEIKQVPVVKDETDAAELLADDGAGEAPPAAEEAGGEGVESTPSGAPAEVAPVVAPVGEKLVHQLIDQYSDEDLHDRMGIDREYIAAARAANTVEDLLDALGGAPDWQADALLDLATGTELTEVRVKLGFDADPDAASEVGAEDSSGTTDGVPGTGADAGDAEADGAVRAEGEGASAEETEADRILAGMQTDAARLSFAVIDGEEELAKVLEDGDFQAWRVFLHPEQRRFAARDYKGPFRLSGGAGTGKTVVLVHRAVRLARANPEARVVLSTYTRNLAAELDAQVKALDPEVRRASSLDEPGVYVQGLDSLVYEVLRNAEAGELSTAVGRVLGAERTTVLQSVKSTNDDERMWKDAVAVAGDDLPERCQEVAFLRDEYEQIVLGNGITQKARYLRVPRPGRGVRLSRGQRGAVWDVVTQYRTLAAQRGVATFEEKRHIAAQVLAKRAEVAGVDVVGRSEAERSSAYVADHVLVDEGQDLVAGHWKFLRSLVRKGTPNDLFIAEDSHQRIYGQKVKLGAFGISIIGRSRRLTLNYRTTELNLAFGMKVLAGHAVAETSAAGSEGADGSAAGSAAGQGVTDLEDNVESVVGYRSLRRGTRPVVRGFESAQAEAEFVAGVIRGWLDRETDPVKPEQIAVLVRDWKAQNDVIRRLSELDVDIQPIDGKASSRGQSPLVMTMHRAKGTEFRNVVLWGVNDGSMPVRLAKERYDEEVAADIDQRERSLLYVAATRARDELVVTWSGKKSELVPGA